MQLCAVASMPCGHEHQNRENARCLLLVFERLDTSGPVPGCVRVSPSKKLTDRYSTNNNLTPCKTINHENACIELQLTADTSYVDDWNSIFDS